ncbi:hypothetical protein [Albimonas pacifica]|uniref:Pentapeptide repeat-containing protein n=1 Tax=Albimonas pacifica TaxID=1114924 RepID=A0A1I3FH27_9RHOB|nr:hypothetical protein [Albimonas pacifica]SFI10211.1 hypothetical protein SAMN05216258_104266 [Albimonas pacifica]
MQGTKGDPAPADPFAPDCPRCAALCCVALAFDRSDLFAFDKPAGEPCRHLAGHACTIHDRLSEAGFGGCVRYDCLGAGQATVQEVFGGRSWRDDPALLAPMMEAFRALRRIRDLAQLLDAAAGLPLPPRTAARRTSLAAALAPPEGWTREALAAFDAGPLPAEIAAFLRTLRDAVPRPA